MDMQVSSQLASRLHRLLYLPPEQWVHSALHIDSRWIFAFIVRLEWFIILTGDVIRHNKPEATHHGSHGNKENRFCRAMRWHWRHSCVPLSCCTVSGHALSFYCIGKSPLCVCFNEMGSSKFMDGVSAHCSFAYKTVNFECSNGVQTVYRLVDLVCVPSIYGVVSRCVNDAFGFRVHWSLYLHTECTAFVHSSTNVNACEIAISGCSITISMKSGHHRICYVSTF